MPLLLIFSTQSSTIYFGVTFSLIKLLLFSHHFHISHSILGLDRNPELTITIQEYLFDSLHRHWFSSLFPSSCYDVVVGCDWVYFLSFSSIQFSRSVVSDLCNPMNCQASLSITNSQSSLRLTSIESVMPSSHLILYRPLLLLPPIPPSIRVFSNESTLRMRGPKYWSFSFNISPSKEIPGLISFRMDWLDLLAVQGTLKSLLQHHS